MARAAPVVALTMLPRLVMPGAVTGTCTMRGCGTKERGIMRERELERDRDRDRENCRNTTKKNTTTTTTQRETRKTKPRVPPTPHATTRCGSAGVREVRECGRCGSEAVRECGSAGVREVRTDVGKVMCCISCTADMRLTCFKLT